MVSDLESARDTRRRKLAEADSLWGELDDWISGQLGINISSFENRSTFAITLNNLKGRFDPQFHLPHFKKVLEALNQVPHVTLGSLVSFSSEMWNSKEALKEGQEVFRYIEISGVNRETGEAKAEDVLVNEAPSRARMIVHDGDLIVSLTRPHHGSIAQIDASLDGCIASTGFAVIRSYDRNRVTGDYLWAILRTQLCLQQVLQRSSGGNYPAITEAELAKLLIPLPGLQAQQRISLEVHRRRALAQRLRIEANTEWQIARQKFEGRLERREQ